MTPFLVRAWAASAVVSHAMYSIRSLRRDRLIVGQREERAGRGNGEAGIAPDTQRAELGVYCAFQSRAGYKTEKGYFFQGSLLKDLSFSSSTPPSLHRRHALHICLSYNL